MRRLCTLVLAFAIPAAAAQAALISVDSPLGSNTIARDTTQGLDWLNLRVTRNMSIGEVLAETIPGGRLEGFRYTNFQEFNTLYRPFLSCANSTGFCDNFDTMRYFINVIGGDPEGFGGPYQLGMTQISDGVPRVFMDNAFFEFFPEPIPRYSFDSQQLAVPFTQRFELGHFIVRPTQAIPAPATITLVGLGLLGLLALKNRAKS